jgi:hypothetical protein
MLRVKTLFSPTLKRRTRPIQRIKGTITASSLHWVFL